MNIATYAFVLLPIVLGVLIGRFTIKPLWIAGAISSVIFIALMSFSTFERSPNEWAAAISIVSPYIAGYSIIIFSIGWLCANFSRNSKPNKTAFDTSTLTTKTTKSKTAYYIALIVVFPFIWNIIISLFGEIIKTMNYIPNK